MILVMSFQFSCFAQMEQKDPNDKDNKEPTDPPSGREDLASCGERSLTGGLNLNEFLSEFKKSRDENSFASKLEGFKDTFFQCACREFPMAVRNKFLRHILGLADTHAVERGRIVVTSFASGELGFEYNLLLELKKKGYKNIELHLIDKIYEGDHITSPSSEMNKFKEFAEIFKEKGIDVKVNFFDQFSSYMESLRTGHISNPDLFYEIDSAHEFKDSMKDALLNFLRGQRKETVFSRLDSDYDAEGPKDARGVPTSLWNFLHTYTPTSPVPVKTKFRLLWER